jgi:hypothetical protein
MTSPQFKLLSSHESARSAATAVIAGLLVTPLLALVVRSGMSLSPHDLSSDYVMAALWALALCVSIVAWPIPLRDRATLIALWILKSVVVLGIMLLYEKNYSSLDAYGYYNAATQSQFDWRATGWGSGTENIQALSWLQNRVLPNSYHALKISFAMVGLVAVYLFYLAGTAALGKRSLRLLVCLALTPSILFWSSILGKDPIVLFGMGLFALGAVRWARGNGAPAMALALAGIVIASLIRLWFAPILVFTLLTLVLVKRKAVFERAILVLFVGTLLVFGLGALRDKFFHESTVDIVEAANTYSQAWAQGGSAQHIEAPFQSTWTLIAFLPKGMFSALLRPLPGEIQNLFGLLAGLENALLFALVMRAGWRLRGSDFRDPVLVGAVVLIVTWSAVYSFISYQNLGSSVRFRLQVLPILLMLLLYLGRRREANNPPSRFS